MPVMAVSSGKAIVRKLYNLGLAFISSQRERKSRLRQEKKAAIALASAATSKGKSKAQRVTEKPAPSEGTRSRASKATAASKNVSRKYSGQKSSNLGCPFFMRS